MQHSNPQVERGLELPSFKLPQEFTSIVNEMIASGILGSVSMQTPGTGSPDIP
jgi:hypothetical protein